jgi:hypothetical protein
MVMVMVVLLFLLLLLVFDCASAGNNVFHGWSFHEWAWE